MNTRRCLLNNRFYKKHVVTYTIHIDTWIVYSRAFSEVCSISWIGQFLYCCCVLEYPVAFIRNISLAVSFSIPLSLSFHLSLSLSPSHYVSFSRPLLPSSAMIKVFYYSEIIFSAKTTSSRYPCRMPGYSRYYSRYFPHSVKNNKLIFASKGLNSGKNGYFSV